MSRLGTSKENAVMEAINGWVKEELFNDFKTKVSDDIRQSVEDYNIFFNENRPAYALNHLAFKQVKDVFLLTSSEHWF